VSEATGSQVRFKKPAELGPDAALALEDYARAASSRSASLVLNGAQEVIGIEFVQELPPIPAESLRDIEGFFESLVSDAADRLGWN